MFLIDVHAHLADEKFADVDEVVATAYASGVQKIICSAADFSSSQKAVALAQKFANVYANVGIHPDSCGTVTDEMIENLETLAQEKKVVAIGEIGLDYHYVSDNKVQQFEAFEKQIALANKLCKPIVVHTRDAMGDTIELLKRNKLNRESVIHCFSGSYESAKILMDLGFSFSIGGVVTFSNAKNVVETVKQIPLSHLMLETDCPYLAPVPFRGQINQPRNVLYVADTIAKIKGVPFEEVIEKTTQNALRVFEL